MNDIGAVASRRLVGDLQSALPRIAARVLRWRRLETLAEKGLSPRSHPALWFPFWIAPASAREADIAFQSDVAYSTLSGYCGIRLLDDITDGDHPTETLRSLLPAAAYFLSRFQFEYSKYFHNTHPFWPTYHSAWESQADAAVADANLVEVSREQFDLITAHKSDAARIPIAAAAFRYELAEAALLAWIDFADAIAALHQMMNDILGWRSDLEHGIGTFALTTFRRGRRYKESPEAWWEREGLQWAEHTVLDLFRAAFERARTLNSPEAEEWLIVRQEAWKADFGGEVGGLKEPADQHRSAATATSRLSSAMAPPTDRHGVRQRSKERE